MSTWHPDPATAASCRQLSPLLRTRLRTSPWLQLVSTCFNQSHVEWAGKILPEKFWAERKTTHTVTGLYQIMDMMTQIHSNSSLCSTCRLPWFHKTTIWLHIFGWCWRKAPPPLPIDSWIFRVLPLHQGKTDMACLHHMTATPDLCACPAPPPRLSVPLLIGMAQKKGMDRSTVVRQSGTSELQYI